MTIKRYENNGLRKDGEESVPAICRLQVTERRDEGMNNNSGNDKTMTIHDVARELGAVSYTHLDVYKRQGLQQEMKDISYAVDDLTGAVGQLKESIRCFTVV